MPVPPPPLAPARNRHWSCIEYERAAVVPRINQFELLFLMLPAEYVEQSLCNGLVSVCLSRRSTAAAAGLLLSAGACSR